MPDSFGARLRRRREEQQIALTTIAVQTKIGLPLLEALERDDLSHWPGGIFRRAFVRAYAQAIGLEPDIVVREFLELYPDPIDVVAALQASAQEAAASSGGPARLQHLAGSAISSLSSLGRRIVQRRGSSADAAAFADVPAAPRGDPPPAGSFPVADADPIATSAGDVLVPDAPGSSIGTAVATTDDAAQVSGSDTAEANIGAEAMNASAPEPDLLAAAHLCTSFSRLADANEAAPLLREAVRILGASGLIVWVWDPLAAELCPALAHGYADKVLAQLPRVGRDDDNATAAAFRLSETCVVTGTGTSSGALVVPLMTPEGCAGVLAIELPNGREQQDWVRALATIFAAQLATFVGSAELATHRRPA